MTDLVKNNHLLILSSIVTCILLVFCSCGTAISLVTVLDLRTSSGPVSGMEFITIPSGEFMMGSPLSEGGDYSCVPDHYDQSYNEGPVHRVDIDSFEMMSTEVTKSMWITVMRIETEEESNSPGIHRTDHPNRPVLVSWSDCQEFINKLNWLDPNHTYRLPSESEWEYACRAGTTTRFYWGEDSGETDNYAWDDRAHHQVAQKFPNAWGLYDMSGNAVEWTADVWNYNYVFAPTDGRARLNGTQTYREYVNQQEYNRVARYGIRSADRACRGPYRSAVGFRLVRSEKTTYTYIPSIY